MRKGSDIIGKPVVAYDSGDRFEKVEDIIFDPEGNKVVAFLLEEGGWFSNAKVLPLQDARSLGPDAVIVDSKNVVVEAEKVPDVKRVIEHGNVLKGRRIMTTDGRDLGKAQDLFFDDKTGTVEGYEVSGGIFADAYSGRSFVPAGETLKIGEDVAFVTAKTADLMQEQVGGLKGEIQAAGGKIGEAGKAAGEKVGEFGRTAGEKVRAGSEGAMSELTSAAVEPEEQKNYVTGKTVDEDVKAPDGRIIVEKGQQVTRLQAEEAERQGVLDKLYRTAGGSLMAGISSRAGKAMAGQSVEQARGRRAQSTVFATGRTVVVAQGQIVTDQVIARARTYGKEQELLQAVGMSPQEATGGAFQSGTESLSRQVSEGARGAGEAASGLWERVQSGLGDVQERTVKEREESRINNALGRPVNRVILDRQDNVILNTGEIITHRAVERAREAGVLDILLDSVYKGQPEVSEEQMRAPEPGQTSLEEQDQGM